LASTTLIKLLTVFTYNT